MIPLLITARAHSHSVQSMERYHEEYHRLRDKDAAIVKSYTEIYAPAMVSLLADGLAVLTLLVARIPMIQKLAVAVLLLDRLDLRQRRDAAPDHPRLHAAARAGRDGAGTGSSASCHG